MFERFANGKRRDWKRRAVLVGSLGAHGAVVVALLVASWFHVDELTPPLLAVVFVPSAPPVQQTAEAPRSRPHASAHRAQPPALHQPSEPTPPAPSDPGDEHPSDEPPGPPGIDRPGVGPPGPPGPPCGGAN